MKLKCNRCEKEWEYKGEVIPNKSYPQYTSCPRCKTSVKIKNGNENQNNKTRERN